MGELLPELRCKDEGRGRMSVIVHGIDMPNCCQECPLNHDSRCVALGALPDEGNGMTRRDECPLEDMRESDASDS